LKLWQAILHLIALSSFWGAFQGTTFEIVGSFKRGEKLVALGEEGDWYNVELPNGKTGCIHKKLISK